MDETQKLLDDIVRAWTEEGRHPPTHRAAQAKLRKEWPTLARAVERVVNHRARATIPEATEG